MGQMMEIRTENDITPSVARSLREKTGLTQKQFWESVGSNQPSGHWYERGKRRGIPRPIRILIFQRYVAGIELDYSSPEEASAAISIGRSIAAKVEARRAKEEADKARRRAQELEKKAKSVAA